ncbi:MAG: Omp28-related outer membrane protein [Bacteroidales bacterium]|nr:Omp28-related outer membrane protein [Bacteroidales bacterium]
MLINLAFTFASACYSQTLTDTLPHSKNAVLEVFTAVRCSFCPAGHRLLDSIIGENPGRIIPVSMHPYTVGSSLTTPYSGSPDLRRIYIDAFFTIPFVHESMRFFPGAFINRRTWQPAIREQSTDKWRQFTDTILNESSPLNIGIGAVYNPASSLLSIDVEVYFTDTVNETCTLYVMLTEDSIVAEQKNGGVNYIHNHVFREALTAQWGDTLCTQANKDSLFLKNFVFDNSTSQYLIQNSNIVAYLRNAANEKIITGAIITANNIIVSANKTDIKQRILLYPNPSKNHVFVDLQCEGSQAESQDVKIYDITGKLCLSQRFAAKELIFIDLHELKQGLYLVKVNTGNNVYFSKLVKD